MRTTFLLALLAIAFLSPADSNADVVTVGQGADCQYSDLQYLIDHAITGNVDTIHIQKGFTSGPISIPARVHYLAIVGGFANCGDAAPDPAGDTPSVIDGSGINGRSVVNVQGQQTYLYLQNLLINGHQASPPQNGGGVYSDTSGCSGNLDCGLELHNVRITSASASGSGGGIYLREELNSANRVVLILDGVSVDNNSSGGAGGGLYVFGRVEVDITNSVIASNAANAGIGGGAYFSPSASSSRPLREVILHHNTLIFANAAQGSGGGIHFSSLGSAGLLAEEPGTSIYSNSAGGDGGGLYFSRASVVLRSVGVLSANGNQGVVYGNFASNGGGIAATDGTTIQLSSADTIHPAAIQANHANAAGGAIFLGRGTSIVSVNAHNFALLFNSAADGAAVYTQSGSANPTFVTSPASPTCVGCVIQGNVTGSYDGQGHLVPNDGALFRSGANLIANGLRVLGNQAGRAFQSTANGELDIFNTLVAANSFSQDVVRTDGDGPVLIDSTTIADNTIEGNVVLSSGAMASVPMTLDYSIISQPGKLAYSGNLALIAPRYSVLDERSSSNADVTNAVFDPRFVNRATGDYHLNPFSPAVDFAPYRSNAFDNDVDLDGGRRTVSVSANSNRRDAGAYEVQILRIDIIFKNGFD